MGQKCKKKPILAWLRLACANGTIQKRKFYTADELYSMYKTAAEIKTVKKNDDEDMNNYFKVRSFCSILNKIIHGKDFVQLKSKYSKDNGYNYIILYDNMISSSTLKSLRISSRKQAPTIATTPSIAPPVAPNTTPTIVPFNLLPFNILAPSPLSPLLATSTNQIHTSITNEQLVGVDPTTPIKLIISLPQNIQNIPINVEFVKQSSEFQHQEKLNTNKLSKFNEPMALSFFLGKDRAKKIAEETAVENFGDVVKAHIMTQVERLQNVNLYNERWKSVVSNYDDEDANDYSDAFKSVIRNKATYLAMVFYLSLDYYDKIPDFMKIIEMAINKVGDAHLVEFLPNDKKCKSNYIVRKGSVRSVFDWFRYYRNNNDTLANLVVQKTSIPPILDYNPDLHQNVLSFCRHNINNLSIESLQHHLYTNALPALAESIKKEQQLETFELSHLLEQYGLKNLSLPTVQRWMKKLGFKYEMRKKTYYVDSHDSNENIEYRTKFVERYFAYELLAHRWYCIPAAKRDKMVEEGKISKSMGYKFEKEDGRLFYEFHVDDHDAFQLACDSLPYGGNLSVRKPSDKKALMMLGQDEVIMKQFLFTLLSWTLPDGSKPLIPKDEGAGLMLSAITSRELGFGFTVSESALEAVNEKRMNMKYSDEKAATVLFGKPEKQKLTTTPFVRELEYGQNKEGYWSYEHMVIQLEDCVDVLKHLYPDFDFLFLVDHSNGHDRL